jgi:hypothetical protein
MAEGPELLTNGDFATDFSSWTDTSPGSGGFARRYAPSANMEVASGFIFVPPIGPQPATATGSQSFTVTVSTTYVVRFDVDTAASAPVSKGGVSTSSHTPENWVPSAVTPLTSVGSKVLPFTSPGSGTTLYAKHMMTGTSSPTTRTDNWSVKETGLAGDFRPIIMFY